MKDVSPSFQRVLSVWVASRIATHFTCLIPAVACSRAVHITPQLGPKDAHRARMLSDWAASKPTKFEL